MIKLILFAVFISLPAFAQDIPETMPEETTEFVTSEGTSEETVVTEPETATTTTTVEETPAVAEPEPAVEETNTPVITTEEAPEVVAPVAIKEEEAKTPVLSTTQGTLKRREEYIPLESHWLVSYGFEGMKYPTLFEFTGAKDSFSPGEAELYGGRLGFGGEIYLGAGVFTTTKVEGYYMGTLFSEVLNGGTEDEEVKFAYTKETGQIWGFDASQSLGYMFDMKTKNPFMEEMTYLTVEPFIEAGIGIASAYNRINYSYVLAGTDEEYRLRVEDKLVNAKLGIGVNFTASSAFYFFVKVTQNRYDITDREAYKLERTGGGPNVTSNPELDDSIDTITVYALGGGYKF